MQIAIEPTGNTLCQLFEKTLTYYDISGAAPVQRASETCPDGRVIAGCTNYLAILTGKIAPAGSSVRKATVLRFDWRLDRNLRPLAPFSVGEVERRGLSLSVDGSKLVVTDWKTCRVTLFDGQTGTAIASGGDNIPSGASISPDASHIIAGTADQGEGAILYFDVAAIQDKTLVHEELPEPKKSPGLDDAPYFSVWSSDGTLAAISNQSWGGRGVFMYNFPEKSCLWSHSINAEEESEPEEWFAQPMAFALGGTILLVAEPGKIRGYRVSDGKNLGAIKAANGDGSCGFAIQDQPRLVWIPGETPQAIPYLPKWLTHTTDEAPTSAPKATKKKAKR